MPAADYPILGGGTSGSGAVPGGFSADPWVERDRLAMGQPVRITNLAAAFARGGRDAQLAAELAEQASSLTADGHMVDGTPVHRFDAEVARSRELLGDSGQNMVRVSRILDEIADDLTARTDSANRDVDTVEYLLARYQQLWDDYDVRYQQAMSQAAAAVPPMDTSALNEGYVDERNRLMNGAQGVVDFYGRIIARSVGEYDTALGGRGADLAAMGYLPPADLAAGPGDVAGDPDAGARDATTLQELLDQPPSPQTLAGIDALTSDIRILNDQVARGAPLPDAQRGYLTQFYDTLGADGLAALPEYVRQGAPGNQNAYDATIAPFGDSILNLSNQTTDDAGNQLRYEQMVPESVLSLINAPIGVIDPDTGLRWANDRFLQPGDANPDPRNPSAHLLAGGVAGLGRYQGIVDVLGASDRAPGTRLATDLVDSAVSRKQELNALQESGRRYLGLTMGGGTDAAVAGLDGIVDDRAASDALTVASRNVEASSAALVGIDAQAALLGPDWDRYDEAARLGPERDGDTRAAVLGLNWEDGTGAANLIASGTQRDPTAGGGTELQARAGLAVVQEVAGDRNGYLERMSEPVKDAVNGVGISYLDALAAPSVDQSGLELNQVDALGRPLGPTFELTAADRDNYLQFVSGTGEDRAAQFQAQSRLYSEAAVADVLINATGTPEDKAPALDQALRSAGRLDGAITQAHFDYTADGAQDADAVAAAAARAATIEGRATQGEWNTGVAALREIGGKLVGLAPGGGLIREFGSPLIAVIAEIGKGEVGNQTLPDAPPTATLPQTLEELRRQDSVTANLQRDLLLARAAEAAGLYGPGDTPTVLTQDADGDGRVDSPTSDGLAQEQLAPAVGGAYREWGLPTAQNSYSDERGTTMSETYGGAGSPADSAWRDGDGLYYGGSTAPAPVFGGRAPDPRLLDDPLYDPVRQEMRPR